MDKVIFELKNDKQKYEDMLQHIDWFVKQFEDNKRELDEYRAGTRENEIIKKKDEQIAKFETKLHEYELKKWDIINFGFSEEELNEAGKWIEEHYKNSGHRGGAAGGNFSYIIIPTGLGIIKEVKCSCGASHTIQDLI